MKKSLIIFAAGLVAVITPGCNNKEKQQYEVDSDTAAVVVEEDIEADSAVSYYDEPIYDVPPIQTAEERYREKYSEVYSADIHTLYGDGKKIWYSPWTSENECGWLNYMYVYDSETDSERKISLNKTTQDDEAMGVIGLVERNGILTIIMEENRNSNGWVEGTFVWQYNCRTGTWKALAKGCAGAEFVNGGKAVKITTATCLNPDDYTYLQEYKYHYRTINL